MARVLVADDEDAVREFIVRALRTRGHEVDAVADGLEALQTLGQRDYGLLITDIVMPGLDGVELSLKVAVEWPKLAILLITGYAAERQRAHNLDALIHEVITKPFDLRQICNRAVAALGGGRLDNRGTIRIGAASARYTPAPGSGGPAHRTDGAAR